jgi:hypothetical protein
MESLLQNLGLSSGEMTQVIVLSVILIIGLFLARIALKLTAALFRIGCFVAILIVAAVFFLNLLN